MSEVLPDFLERISATIEYNRLLEEGETVVVGLSGGADSVALLAALKSLGYNCVAAHCNFGLRGEESERDMRHAQTICHRLDVGLLEKRFDVAERCRQTGESVEMACRELRYAWFLDLLDSEHSRVVAVGHHREDSVETVLINLFRGTGLSGLCGIRYRRDYIIRPMLDVTRKDIENYLAQIGLDFVFDSSNASDIYHRNRVRNCILPEITRNFPGAEAAILKTARNLAATQSLYQDAIGALRRQYSNADGEIDVRRMARELGEEKSATLLFELFKDRGIGGTICHDIVRSAGVSGLKFKGRGYTTLRLDHGMLYVDTFEVCPREVFQVRLDRDIVSPVNIRISRHFISDFKPERDPSVAYLDIKALDAAHSWSLRHWIDGDKIKPYGMDGTKLISDIFADAKLNALQKASAWILTCDDIPVWVVGLRASRQFQVTPHSKEFIKLKLITN